MLTAVMMLVMTAMITMQRRGGQSSAEMVDDGPGVQMAPDDKVSPDASLMVLLPWSGQMQAE